MDNLDREKIAEFVNYIWGPGTIAPKEVNRQVVFVLHNALRETGECSEAMDYVPRMPKGPADLSWALKELKAAIKRIMKRKIGLEKRPYTICSTVVAANYRTPLEMAKMGMIIR